jgi:hypothetical protein
MYKDFNIKVDTKWEEIRKISNIKIIPIILVREIKIKVNLFTNRQIPIINKSDKRAPSHNEKCLSL